MSNNNLPAPASANLPEEPIKPDFKGYTMEELKYQKALVALRKEFCKSNMLHSVDSLKHPVSSTGNSSFPLLSSGSSSHKSTAMRVAGTATKVITKTLMRNMKPLDYIMLGVSLIGPVRKILGMFKKKKKK